MKLCRPPAPDGARIRVRAAPFRGLLVKTTTAQQLPSAAGGAVAPDATGADQHVLKVGDLLRALPGELAPEFVEDFREGDEGTVQDFFRDQTSGELLFSLASVRTGGTSFASMTSWSTCFDFVRRQGLEVGVLLKSLPYKGLEIDGSDIYKPGDEGTLQEFYEEDGQRRISITWSRTGRTSTLPEDSWISFFRVLRRQDMEAGDLVQALPHQDYTDARGEECCSAGDEGTVEAFYAEDGSGRECFTIVWARTGRSSNWWRDRWMEHVKLLRKQAPKPGDTLQALPGRSFVDKDGTEYYKAGDEGRLDRVFKKQGTSERMIEILWSRTGRPSISQWSSWMSHYRLVHSQTWAVRTASVAAAKVRRAPPKPRAVAGGQAAA